MLFPTMHRCLSQQQGLFRSHFKHVQKNFLYPASMTQKQKFSVSPISRSSIDHGKLWDLERLVSLVQIPALIVPFAVTTPLTDAFFCTFVTIHSHWGIEAIVIDYIRPVLFGGNTLIPKLCRGLVWILSATMLGGLFYFNYTDVGIVNAIKMLWTS